MPLPRRTSSLVPVTKIVGEKYAVLIDARGVKPPEPTLMQRFDQDQGIAEVIVGKHRNGPTGKIQLAWLEQYTKFASLARRA